MNQIATTDTPQGSSLMEMVERAARDPAVDIHKMERLMAMVEKQQQRVAEQAFNEAMNLAQEEMGPVSKDASNPQTRSKYASYAALDQAVRSIYSKHGFSLSFDTESLPSDMIRVVCKVAHRDGHAERPHLDLPADGKGAKGGDVMTKTHATMSAVTYGKRGLLKMIFNIAEGDLDDDGNAASGPRAPAQPKMSEGAMKARAWMSAAVHDLEGFTEASELEGFLTDMRGHCLRICRDYRRIWIAPNFSGLRDVITKAAQRCGIAPETQNYLDKLEAEAADTTMGDTK